MLPDAKDRASYHSRHERAPCCQARANPLNALRGVVHAGGAPVCDVAFNSIVKLLAGAVFLALAWGLEATVAGFVWGPLWAAPTFAAGIATGYVALRFEELRREAAEAWRLVMLRAFHHQTTARLAERRRALADQVARAKVKGRKK